MSAGSDSTLKTALAHARCILWESRVLRPPSGGGYHWDLHLHCADMLRREFGLIPGPGESEGDLWQRLISSLPGQMKRMDATSDTALRSGAGGYEQEFQIAAADGSPRWLKELVEIVPTAPSEWSLVGVAIDITEHKRATAELAEERLLLRNLVDTLPDYLFIKDAQCRFVLVNAPFVKFAGARSSEDLIGKTVFDILPREAAERFFAEEQEVLKSGEPIFDREQFIGTDASGPVWLSVTKVPLRDSHGRITGLVGTSTNISERKRAEERLALVVSGVHCLLWHAIVEQHGDDATWDLHISNEDAARQFLPLEISPGRSYDAAYMACKLPEDLPGMHATSHAALMEGRSGYSHEFRCRRAGGGVRWLREDVRIHSLAPERWRLIGVGTDVTERKLMEQQLAQANEQLQNLASHDSLTGLLNRRVVLERTEIEWTRWKRYGKPFSVMIVDVDDFKAVNDRLGHLAGDQVLKTVASRLLQSTRTADCAGRYGGEEFVVVLPETALEGAVSAGNNLLLNVSSSPIQSNGGEQVPVTISVGVATVARPDKDIDALLQRADTALYAAKRAGKNRVMASPSA